MRSFDCFIGIDYSGAVAPNSRLKSLQVYAVRSGGLPEKVFSAAKSHVGGAINWTRSEIAHYLLDKVKSDERLLVGIDHCFSFPWSYFQRYGLNNWPAFLDDFSHHWPTRDDHIYVDFVRDGRMHREYGAPAPGQRIGGNQEFRIAERWTSSAKSVFHFDVQGSVAKSSHAGIPWLKWLRDQAAGKIHFWPFDGWTPARGKSVILEAYPSMFRRRYARDGRTPDEQDAYATSRWMADMDARGALADFFSPPLSEAELSVAACEGWIFGVR